jgi:hypothetical protein
VRVLFFIILRANAYKENKKFVSFGSTSSDPFNRHYIQKNMMERPFIRKKRFGIL